MILSEIPLEALVEVVLSQEAAVPAVLMVGARAAVNLLEPNLHASHLQSQDQGLLVLALHQGPPLCQDMDFCSKLGIGFWDLVGICFKLHATHMVAEIDLDQDPDLLCPLVETPGARVLKDAALAGVLVGVEAGVGARVYPGRGRLPCGVV
ncbi:hypothetical protein V6N11_001318 [Hibiscus sabdariffa]|uniref:Uncharacterized protein n=1 Tax=Hibiscus sabdariffa TaxID=183260 RepID=A0ABR2RZF1_9ROSI